MNICKLVCSSYGDLCKKKNCVGVSCASNFIVFHCDMDFIAVLQCATNLDISEFSNINAIVCSHCMRTEHFQRPCF